MIRNRPGSRSTAAHRPGPGGAKLIERSTDGHGEIHAMDSRLGRRRQLLSLGPCLGNVCKGSEHTLLILRASHDPAYLSGRLSSFSAGHSGRRRVGLQRPPVSMPSGCRYINFSICGTLVVHSPSASVRTSSELPTFLRQACC